MEEMLKSESHLGEGGFSLMRDGRYWYGSSRKHQTLDILWPFFSLVTANSIGGGIYATNFWMILWESGWVCQILATT